MENGTLRDYYKSGKSFDIISMVRVKAAFNYAANLITLLLQATGIASGLSYLHSRSVVHGDMKCVST